MENKQRKKRKLNESDQKTSNDTSEDEDFIRKVPHRRGKSTQTQTTKTQSKRPRPTRRKEIASVEGIKGEFLVVRCDEEPGFWLCILTKSASKTDLKNEKKKSWKLFGLRLKMNMFIVKENQISSSVALFWVLFVLCLWAIRNTTSI